MSAREMFVVTLERGSKVEVYGESFELLDSGVLKVFGGDGVIALFRDWSSVVRRGVGHAGGGAFVQRPIAQSDDPF